MIKMISSNHAVFPSIYFLEASQSDVLFWHPSSGLEEEHKRGLRKCCKRGVKKGNLLHRYRGLESLFLVRWHFRQSDVNFRSPVERQRVARPQESD